VQPLSQQQVEERSLKYYNSDVHRAAFILPEFARKVSKAALLFIHQGRGMTFLRQKWEYTGLGISCSPKGFCGQVGAGQHFVWHSRVSQSGKTGVQFGTVLWVDVPCLDGRSLLLHLPKRSPRACRTGVSHWKVPKVFNKMWLSFL